MHTCIHTCMYICAFCINAGFKHTQSLRRTLSRCHIDPHRSYISTASNAHSRYIRTHAWICMPKLMRKSMHTHKMFIFMQEHHSQRYRHLDTTYSTCPHPQQRACTPSNVEPQTPRTNTHARIHIEIYAYTLTHSIEIQQAWPQSVSPKNEGTQYDGECGAEEVHRLPSGFGQRNVVEK
jgi:hypothetical protein